MGSSLFCDVFSFFFTWLQDLVNFFYSLAGLSTIEALNLGSFLGCNV